MKLGGKKDMSCLHKNIVKYEASLPPIGEPHPFSHVSHTHSFLQLISSLSDNIHGKLVH